MSVYLKTKDYSVSGESFELTFDEDKQMLITTPQPESLNKYYESEDYISHTDASKSLVDKIYQVVKKYSLAKKLVLIESLSSGSKKLLDVGAGTGDFLSIAKNNKWNVFGVEPNTRANQLASKKGLQLFANIEELGETNFDVITLWHVLEHLPNLESQIEKFKALLSDNGSLIIAVPNYKSYDAKKYGAYWAAYDVPRHLWHFSQSAIKRLFSNMDMEVVKTKPMIFDSFYVSLLSEKYKTGKQNFLRGFISGLKSNLSAINTGEYSSLIYIIKKR